jgi:hypothetical protein
MIIIEGGENVKIKGQFLIDILGRWVYYIQDKN